MAPRGRRPKPAHLRLVDGTHRTTRHGDAGEARETVETTIADFGPLTMPKGLTAGARKAWRRFIAPASWLDGSREMAAIALCEMWVEFEMKPGAFSAARHGQLRAYQSLLGLTDERNRPKPATPHDEFFDDA